MCSLVIDKLKDIPGTAVILRDERSCVIKYGGVCVWMRAMVDDDDEVPVDDEAVKHDAVFYVYTNPNARIPHRFNPFDCEMGEKDKVPRYYMLLDLQLLFGALRTTLAYSNYQKCNWLVSSDCSS